MATAFAIFCANDGSLTFYKRDTVPTVGDEFEGKVVSNVYTDAFETTIYGSNGTPWHNERTSILSVNFVDVIAPIHISRWFFQCSNLESIDFDNLDTSNTQSMNDVFNGCSSLISLDLSNINTSSATSMTRMFYGCSNLTTICVSERWSTAALTSSTKMFEGCTSLVGAIPYDSSVTDKTHANYQTGYLTYKFYADYLKNRFVIDGKDLNRLANAIRRKTGKTGGLAPENMEAEIDSVKTFDDLPTLTNPAGAENIDSGFQSIDQNGTLVEGTSTKVQLPALSNPASADNIESGYEVIDASGAKVTGTGAMAKYRECSVKMSTSGYVYVAYVGEEGFVSTSASKTLTFTALCGSIVVYKHSSSSTKPTVTGLTRQDTASNTFGISLYLVNE